MSESRICPVCENEIPEDARYYYCPHCFFDFEILNDEIAIQEARQKFTGELLTVEKRPENKVEKSYAEQDSSISWALYAVGVLGNLLFGLFIVDGASDGHFYFPFGRWFFFLPFGILAGYIGTWMEKMAPLTLPGKLGLLIFTIILSIFFSFGCTVITFFLFW